jgi:penicillin amidase
MWQMEMSRRTGAGRLSEVLGEAALPADKFLRTLGTHRAAAAAWPALAPRTQALLEAYAAGVNAWLAEGHTLPPEYLILGFEPEPWTITDSLVWTKIMAWDMGGDGATMTWR